MSSTASCPDYSRERAVAVQAVELASRVCTEVYDSLLSCSANVNVKTDMSPVTIADYASQAIIIATLRREFPDASIVAEEDSSMLRLPAAIETCHAVTSLVQNVYSDMTQEDVLRCIDCGLAKGGEHGTFWALDPIDGTKGYVKGRHYAICLGLVVEGHAVLGVLGCPNFYPPMSGTSVDRTCGSLYVAISGRGAFMKILNCESPEIAISVSDVSDIANASFCESVESDHTNHDFSAEIATSLSITKLPIRLDSQCKYAAVACGLISGVDVYLRPPPRSSTNKARYENIWDHVAGWVIVTEAGGTVTDLLGFPIDFSRGRSLVNNVGIICTNNLLHDHILKESALLAKQDLC